MPQIAAICINTTDPRKEPTEASFDLDHAFRCEEVGRDGRQTFKILSVPPSMEPLKGSGPWLSRNSFGEWERRPDNGGSDEQFVYTRQGTFLVAAHRAQTPAMLSPIQTWAE